MKKMNECVKHSYSPDTMPMRKGLLAIILLIVNIVIVTNHSFGQVQERITLRLESGSLEQALKKVEQESHYRLLYNLDLVKDIKLAKIQAENEPVTSLLTRLLQGSNLSFTIQENTIVISRKKEVPVLPEVALVRGIVKDKKGALIPGVTVRIDGTNVGTATDAKGEFSLSVATKTGMLVFTYVGFKTQKIGYLSGKILEVTMEEEVAQLDDVTVIAYGTRKTREIIGAISSVKAEEMKEIPTSGFENLLQGRMAGVEVINQSGAPGGGGTLVVIRGYNTFIDGPSNSAPLYVIDGVPMHSFTAPQTGTNTIAEIDPSIIESVEVLKDAASAAIYGSRAGNGVILITTKKGKKGQARFSANASYTYSILPEAPKHYGGRMERRYNLEALRNYRSASMFTGKIPESYDESKGFMDGIYDFFWNRGNNLSPENTGTIRILQDSLNHFYNNATDWYKEAFRAGKVYNANIQASGGTESIRYMVAAGYYQEQGIMLSSDFNRINANLGLNINPTERLALNTRIYAAYTDRNRGKSTNGQRSNYKIEGLTVDPRVVSSLTLNAGEEKEKLLEALNEQIEKNNSYRFTGNMDLQYEFIKGLKLTVRGGIDFNQTNRNFFRPSTMDIVENRNENYIEGGITRDIFMQGEGLLNYRFSLQDCHYFDLLLGMSTDKNQSFINQESAEGTPSDNIHYIQGVIPIRQWDYYGMIDYQSRFMVSTDLKEKTNVSYFGRLAYNYMQKYLFEATLRRDGSSVFGEDVRWATFPSVAVGWAFSEENFLQSVSWFDFGKIRLSWGQSGVQFNDPYLAHGLIRIGGVYNGETGMSSNGLLSRDLSWEQSDQYDVGLDLDFFQYRLKLKCDYYYRYTKNKLWEVALPGGGSIYGGYSRQWRNAMEVSNQGLEIEITGDIFRDTPVSWRTKLTLSRNWNRFEKSYSGMDEDGYIIGKPIYNFYLYQDDGFYSSEKEIPVYFQPDGSKKSLADLNGNPYTVGDPKIQDINADGKIDIDDRIYAGSSIPKLYGGWANELKWKDFDLSLLFTYSLGRDMYKTYDVRSLDAYGKGRGGQALYVNTDRAGFWTPENPDADYPRLGSTMSAGGMVISNVEKVNYMKLKTLTIGYNLRKAWEKKIGVGIRIFVTGENIFTLTNYSGVDPEVVSVETGQDAFESYPLARKWTVGLTLNF